MAVGSYEWTIHENTTPKPPKPKLVNIIVKHSKIIILIRKY